MKNKPVQKLVGFVTTSARRDHRFNLYEVSPTIPGLGDKERDKQISNAIAELKTQHIEKNSLR